MSKMVGWKLVLAMVVVVALLVGCGKGNGNEQSEQQSNAQSEQPAPEAAQPEQKEEEAEPAPEPEQPVVPAEIKTYVHWDFDGLEDGGDIPDTAGEGAGFKAIQVDGNGWVVSNNPQDWAAFYMGVSDENGDEIFLENFAVETSMYLPEDNDGLTNDGGIPLFVAAEGRYDASIHFGEGGKGTMNLWKAGNTDGGPILTSNAEQFPDRGAVAEFTLLPGQEYVYTIIGTHRKDADDNEFVQLRFYIDDTLIVDGEVPYWRGGFGLRGWQSAIRYDYLKVSDAPLTAPDGTAVYE